MAGVLLVFGFLVIPAVVGVMTTSKPGAALAVGWVFGLVGSVVGLLGAATYDFPAAPSILVTLAGLLIIIGAVQAVTRRGRAAARRNGE
jgi:zinc/manganese transport system permease protein